MPQGAPKQVTLFGLISLAAAWESFLTPGPRKGKGIGTGGQRASPLQWALREEFFHFKPVKESCLSSAGQPGRVRVEKGDE